MALLPVHIAFMYHRPGWCAPIFWREPGQPANFMEKRPKRVREGMILMSNSRDEWISNRAYALWEQNGRQHGQHEEHWQQANSEWEELQRNALPGHVQDGQRDEGMPPEYLQADTQEDPAPRLGRAPSAKKQSKSDTVILGKSQETKSKRRSSRNSVYEEKDYQAL